MMKAKLLKAPVATAARNWEIDWREEVFTGVAAALSSHMIKLVQPQQYPGELDVRRCAALHSC